MKKILFQNQEKFKNIYMDLGDITLIIGKKAPGKIELYKALSKIDQAPLVISYIDYAHPEDQVHQLFGTIFYRPENGVIIFTNSIHLLEIVWVIGNIKKSQLPTQSKIFHLKRILNESYLELETIKREEEALSKILELEYKVYLLKYEDGGLVTKDISSLDPSSEDSDVSGWGGISGFSSRMSDIVASTISE